MIKSLVSSPPKYHPDLTAASTPAQESTATSSVAPRETVAAPAPRGLSLPAPGELDGQRPAVIAAPAPREGAAGMGQGLASWIGARLGALRGSVARVDYRGETVLVTGASSGIGAEFARSLAARGANVILTARSADKLEALAQALRAQQVEVTVLTCDLSEPRAAEGLMARIASLGKQVDVLVNNAGFGAQGRFEALPVAQQRDIMQVNVLAAMDLAHACLPAMRHRGRGVIIHVASIAGFQPMPYMTTYGASKAALLHFSEGLWAENRASGVRVTALCPGATETAFWDAAKMDGKKTFGAMASAEAVVQRALEAVDHAYCYTIPMRKDFLNVHFLRALPRATGATVMADMLRPS